MVDEKVCNDEPENIYHHSDDEDEVESPDVQFEPLMHLPEIDVKTLEEDEETLFKTRAKLFRFETKYDDEYANEPQWKERGVGEVKFLKHKNKGCVRLVMRREQTLKVCANHYILPNMKLVPHTSSNRSWIWTAMADFADEEPKRETLALRFKDAESCQEFEIQFENAKRIMEDYQKTFMSSRSAEALRDSKAGGDVETKQRSSVSSDDEGSCPNDDSDKKSADDLTKNLQNLVVGDHKDDAH